MRILLFLFTLSLISCAHHSENVDRSTSSFDAEKEQDFCSYQCQKRVMGVK